MDEIQVVEEADAAKIASDARAVLLWRMADRVQFGEEQPGGGVWVQRGVVMTLYSLGHQVGSLKLPVPSWLEARDGADGEAERLTPWAGTLGHLARAEYAAGRQRGGVHLLDAYDEACDEPPQWGTERRKEAEQSLKGWLGDAVPEDDRYLMVAATKRLDALRAEISRELTAALAAMPDPRQGLIAPEWEYARARVSTGELPTGLRYFTAIRLLDAWKLTQPAVTRDSVIRLALASDVTKARVSALTGVARTTIDRLLAEDAAR